MKSYILILFFGLATISHGQSIEEFRKRLNFLDNPIKLKYDTTSFSKLPKFEFFCDDDNQNKSDFFSVMDLNDDGLNDLVYSGPCRPYDHTGIFINDGKRLQSVYSFPGAIVSIEKNGSGTTINSLKQSIGCDPDNELIEIVISKKSPPRTNRIKYAVIPKLNLQNLKEVKVKGVLRWSPKQDDADKKDECSDRILKGNHWLLMDKAADAIKLDQSGEWLLILYKKNREESIIGWIKSEVK